MPKMTTEQEIFIKEKDLAKELIADIDVVNPHRYLDRRCIAENVLLKMSAFTIRLSRQTLKEALDAQRQSTNAGE